MDRNAKTDPELPAVRVTPESSTGVITKARGGIVCANPAPTIALLANRSTGLVAAGDHLVARLSRNLSGAGGRFGPGEAVPGRVWLVPDRELVAVEFGEVVGCHQ
jgi:hypothetical protein